MDFPDLVCQEIASYLNPRDLKITRQVCRKWSKNTNVNTRLADTTRTNIQHETALDHLFRNPIIPKVITLEFGITLKEFLEHPRLNDETQPLPEFKEIILSCKFNSQSLLQLLRKCSTSLTSLGINFNFMEINQFHLDWDCEFLKLTTLSPENVSNETHELILGEIVKLSPNLKYFKSRNFNTTTGFILQHLSSTSNKFKNLTKIKIEAEIHQENVQKLTQLCQIEDLTFEMKAYESLCPILNNDWRKLLKSLTINQEDYRYFKKQDSFPKLEELQNLTLNFPFSFQRYFFKDECKTTLEILSDLPKLKCLTLKNTSFEDVFQQNPNFTSNLNSLTVLQFNLPINLIPPMSTAFPNLKELNFLEISNEALLLVCEHLKTLEVLKVGMNITDFGLTAISTGDVRKCLQKVGDGESFQEFRKQPAYFIGSLPNLTRITIISMNITDASVLLGLAYCTKLISITIGKHVISDKAIIFLADADQLRLQKLELQYHDRNISLEGIQYFRKKRLFCQLNIRKPEGSSCSQSLYNLLRNYI